MSWRDALKTAASPLAARERPPSASHVGTRHHGHHRDDDHLGARDGADAPTSLAPPHELDLRNARANAFAPSQPTTLELCVNVYNLHPAFTTRAPLLVCALLIEVPPPTLPYKMPAAWKRAPERHRAWRVAGSTEPSRAACNAHCVRFAVPVVIDKLIGGQRSLENKKAVVAVYRIPEDDEADDAHLAADENLPPTTRPKLTPERLDEFEYLGEAKLRCHELVRAVFESQRDAAEDFAKQSKDNQKSTLDVANDADFPKRSELKAVKRKSPVRDDGAVRAPVGNARAQYALVKSGQRDPVSNPPVPGSNSIRPKNPDNDAFDGAAIEVLAATPVHWPRPTPNDAGRYVADIAVQFEPIAHPSARDLELVFLRINRWVGDGYQPVYGSLVTCADIPTPTTLAPGHANGGVGVGARYIARVPTLHVPVACVKSGGATDEDDEGGFAAGDLLPDGDVGWRIECVARMRTGHDLLLGWVDTSPAALNEAGDAASVDAPAKFECDLARGESDFEPVRLNESVGERPPTLLVSRWKLRPGTNPRAMRARIDRAVKTAPKDIASKPNLDPAPNEEKIEVGKMTVPKGANPLADFGFGPAPTKNAKEPEHKKKAKTPASTKPKPPSPPPMYAVDSDDSSDSSSDDENRDEVADLVAKTNAIAKTKTNAKTKTVRPASSSAAMHSASKKATGDTSTVRRRPATATALVSSRAPPKPKLPNEAKAGSKQTVSHDFASHVMTPMQALLNRTLGVKLPAESKDAMNASVGTSKVMRAVKGVVFLENQMRKEEQTEEPDEYDDFFRKRGHDAAKAKAAIAAAGNAGDETKRPVKRPVTPPEDPHNFDPNPELIAAADGAVREALAERLRGHTKAELVETAMRVRKELLGKCRGEMRALELRRKREERAAQGARGGKGGKG